MTRLERERRGRRILAAGLAVSGAVHVAALFLVVIPGRSLEGADREIVLAPPVVLQLVSMVEEEVPPPVVEAQASAAADAGAGAAAAPVHTAPTPEPSVASAPIAAAGEFTAAVDSAFSLSLVPVVQVASALGQESAAPAPQTQVSGTAAAPRHVPGSAARAKMGGSRGGDGVGASSGKSGISIKIGPKRHGPKRHPPRGFPGRRW